MNTETKVMFANKIKDRYEEGLSPAMTWRCYEGLLEADTLFQWIVFTYNRGKGLSWGAEDTAELNALYNTAKGILN